MVKRVLLGLVLATMMVTSALADETKPAKPVVAVPYALAGVDTVGSDGIVTTRIGWTRESNAPQTTIHYVNRNTGEDVSLTLYDEDHSSVIFSGVIPCGFYYLDDYWPSYNLHSLMGPVQLLGCPPRSWDDIQPR